MAEFFGLVDEPWVTYGADAQEKLLQELARRRASFRVRTILKVTDLMLDEQGQLNCNSRISAAFVAGVLDQLEAPGIGPLLQTIVTANHKPEITAAINMYNAIVQCRGHNLLGSHIHFNDGNVATHIAKTMPDGKAFLHASFSRNWAKSGLIPDRALITGRWISLDVLEHPLASVENGEFRLGIQVATALADMRGVRGGAAISYKPPDAADRQPLRLSYYGVRRRINQVSKTLLDDHKVRLKKDWANIPRTKLTKMMFVKQVASAMPMASFELIWTQLEKLQEDTGRLLPAPAELTARLALSKPAGQRAGLERIAYRFLDM